MKISARNQLKGTVKSVQEGAVNATVTLTLTGGETISSVVTMEAVKELGLQPGVIAYAIIKSNNVMLGTEP